MIRALIPQRAIHVAAIRPAGPAPIMRTSTFEAVFRVKSIVCTRRKCVLVASDSDSLTVEIMEV